jgi:hypothetical protein
VVRVPGYRSRRPGFHSWRYQIFWEAVCLEWGPLSLVSTTKELLGRKSGGSGKESREDPSRWPRGILYPQKLALTSPISGGRSVGIVRLHTQATEFKLLRYIHLKARPLRQTHLLVSDVTQGLWQHELNRKKKSGREPRGALRQDEMIGGHQPVVK